MDCFTSFAMTNKEFVTASNRLVAWQSILTLDCFVVSLLGFGILHRSTFYIHAVVAMTICVASFLC